VGATARVTARVEGWLWFFLGGGYLFEATILKLRNHPRNAIFEEAYSLVISSMET